MPTYFDFKCNTCSFSAKQAITDQPAEEEGKCPKCKSDDVEYKMKF